MKKDREITKVIFKEARYEDGETEIIAFFPGVQANRGMVQCYVHDGQHSEASYLFYLENCRKCTEVKYRALKKELEDFFGYRFKVACRITARDRHNAWDWRV